MANNKQLAKIHIAKKDLGISDSAYRDLLSGWGVSSSKELSEKQAEEVIEALKKIGFKPKAASKQYAVGSRQKIQIELPENRPDEFATQKQMDMLASMWVSYSREKTEESFRKFVANIAKVDMVEWLLKADVQKVRLAIMRLKK